MSIFLPAAIVRAFLFRQLCFFNVAFASNAAAPPCSTAQTPPYSPQTGCSPTPHSAAAHRKVREGTATPSQLAAFIAQVASDTVNGAIVWLPVTESLIHRIEQFFSTAAEHGFTEIYSNDRHLLAAAPLFGLRGVNFIP